MFTYRAQKIWAGVLVFIFFITACGPVTAVPEVKPTLVITPPPATLEVDGVTQTAAIGSYCWSSGGLISKSLCADMAGIPTTRDPLVLTEFPVNAQFHFEIELVPDDVTMSVMPARSGQELVGPDNAHRFWNPSEGWSGSLSPKASFEYPFQETEFVSGDGLYIILINAYWKDRGDASYGFLIQIGAGNQQVSATPGESIPTPELVSLQMMTPVTRLGKGAASSLALSADGKWLAVNTPLGVYGYETETQNEIWFLPLGNHWRVLDFSPDGEHLAIGAQNGGVLVVKTYTGKTLYHIATEESGQPDWSPDGIKLLTGAGCEEVRVWDTNTGALLQTVQEVKCNNVVPGIVRAVWSWDGKRIYVSPGNGYVLAYDVNTNQLLTGYVPHPPEYGFSPNIVPSPTEYLFALENGLSIAILNGRTGEIIKLLEGNRQDVPLGEIAWSPDGKQLAAGNNGEVIVWDVNTGQQIHNIAGYQPLPGLSWMPNGETLAGLLSPDGSLNAMNIDGETVFSLNGFGMVNGYSSALFWDGYQLLTYDGAHITHWEALTGKILKQEQASSQPTWVSAGLSPDGTRIASPDAVMDSKNFKEIVRLIDNPERGRDKVVWSPDGRTLASGDSLNISPIILWDAQTGKQMLTLPTGDIPLYLGGLTFSPDGSLLAAGGSLMNPANGLDNGVLILWNVNSGERVHILNASMTSQRIMSIAWSPDGHWLAAGTNSGRIVLWDMLAFQPVASLDGHANEVFGLSWSDDSSLLASSSIDGTVLIWKLP
jgi:WD40 repeat protein